MVSLDGCEYSKHAGVKSHFDRNYVKTGMFTKEYSQILHKSFERRQVSDYKIDDADGFSTRESAEKNIANAERFVTDVGKVVQAKLDELRLKLPPVIITKIPMKPSYNSTMRTFIEHYNRSIAKDGDPEVAAIKASKMTIKLTTRCDSAKLMGIMYDLLPQVKEDETYHIKILQKIKEDPQIAKQLRNLDKSKESGLSL